MSVKKSIGGAEFGLSVSDESGPAAGALESLLNRRLLQLLGRGI
jgi:hypothetical protein